MMFMIFSDMHNSCKGPKLDAWRSQISHPIIANKILFVNMSKFFKVKK